MNGVEGGQREFEIFLANEASSGLREFHERIQVINHTDVYIQGIMIQFF